MGSEPGGARSTFVGSGAQCYRAYYLYGVVSKYAEVRVVMLRSKCTRVEYTKVVISRVEL